MLAQVLPFYVSLRLILLVDGSGSRWLSEGSPFRSDRRGGTALVCPRGDYGATSQEPLLLTSAAACGVRGLRVVHARRRGGELGAAA